MDTKTIRISDNVLLRRAIAADMTGIQCLAKQTWEHTYDGVICLEDQAKVLKHFYSDKKLLNAVNMHIFIIAEVDGSIAGYVDMEHRGDVLYLHRLYVSQFFQRRGIGKRLLDTAIFESTKLVGTVVSFAPKLVIATVVTVNKKARSFYKKNGFREESETAIVLGNTELPAIYIVKCLS